MRFNQQRTTDLQSAEAEAALDEFAQRRETKFTAESENGLALRARLSEKSKVAKKMKHAPGSDIDEECKQIGEEEFSIGLKFTRISRQNKETIDCKAVFRPVQQATFPIMHFFTLS